MDRLISEKQVLNVINRYGTDELRIKAIKAIPSVDIDTLIDGADAVGYRRGYKEAQLAIPSADKWIPVNERLPEEKINPKTNDFEEVLCTTIWGDVRAYKFGTPIGHDKPHFWLGGGIMDEYVIAWQPLPEPYKKGGAE